MHCSQYLDGLPLVWKYRGQKSNFTSLNSSVTECPIEIILSGMTYYHQGICQIERFSCSFFSNEGSFSYLFDSRIEPNFIGLCLAIRITFVLKK